MKTKTLLLGMMAALLCATIQAQIPMSSSTQQPVPGYFDQYYLPGAVVEGLDTIGSPDTNNGYAGIINGFSGNNDQYTYVSNPDRQSKAQSFTTGPSALGYTLKSFIFQQVQGTNGSGGSGNGWLNNGTYFLLNNGDSVKVRVGSLSGPNTTSYTTILETNATYTGTTYSTPGGAGQTYALGVYVNFDLSGANLTLSSNATYFVEVMATGSDHWELNNTDTNPVSTNIPPVYLKGRALMGNTTADLDRTGAFGVGPHGGVFAFDAGLAAVGAPTVVATAKPSSVAAGLSFNMTVVVSPGIGTVTNVSVNLSSIGGSAAAQLVLSNANVYTNTFTVDPNAPVGTTNLMVTAMQDTRPDIIGVGFTPLTVVSPNAPVFQDITPGHSGGVIGLYAGQGLTFSAIYSGPGPITYQWQQNNADVPGATNATYTISSYAGDGSDDGYWTVTAHNAFGDTPSGPSGYVVSTLISGVPEYLWSQPIPFAGLNSDQILTNFPANDKIAGALVAKNGGSPILVTNSNGSVISFAGSGAWASLSGGAGYFTGANTNQTGNTNFNSCLNAGYNDNATHTVTLNGLVVGQKYQVQLFALDDRSGLTPTASSRLVTWQDPTNTDDVTQPYAMSDNVYMLGTFTASNTVQTIQQNMLTNSGNFNCLVLRTVGWEPPPYLTANPANVGGFVGTNVSMTASAAGDTTVANPTITYQWMAGPTNGPFTNLVEGAKYAGTTTGTLTISNLTTADAIPAYLLVAANNIGSVTSSVANVFVQSAPVPPVPGSYGAYALSNNAVGFWQLNETDDPSSGFVRAYDFTGNGNNGTYGTASKNGFNGIMGPTNLPGFAPNQGALETTANTTASRVAVPPFGLNTNTSAITTNGVTIAMWIKPAAGQGTFTGLFFYRNNTVEGFGFGGTVNGAGMPGLGYTWNNNSASTYNFNSGLYPPIGVWSFVGVVVNSNNATLFMYYVDPNTGNPVLLSAVNTLAHNTYTFTGGTTYIGSDSSNPNRTFAGDISDVAIYNSALPTSQLLQLFGAGLQTAGFAPQISSVSQDIFYPAPLAAGRAVTISATSIGTAPVTNQWAFNDANLTDGAYLGATVSGSKTASLTVSNLTYNNTGSYQLLVTNAFGMTNSPAVKFTVLPATLVGQWLTVSNSLADASGFTPAGTHDAAVQSGSVYWTNDVPSIAPPGSASLYFNNAGLQVSNSATSDAGYTNTFDNKINNGITVMCWAKGWPSGQWNPWVSKYGENSVGWQLRRNGGTNNSCWTTRSAVGGGDMSAFLFSNDGKWHHYAGTLDPVSGNKRLYVDGVLVATGTGNGPVTMGASSHLMIGARDQAGSIGNYYTGEIYDVRVYDYALPQNRIVGIVNGTPGDQNYVVTPGAFLTFTTPGINAAPPYTGYQWQFNGANLNDGVNNGAIITGSSTISLTVTNITPNNAGVYQLLVTNAAGVTTGAVANLSVTPTSLVGNWLPGTQTLTDVSGFSPGGTHDAGVTNGTVGWSADVPASAPGGSYSLAFTNAGLIISNSSVFDAGYTNTYDGMINYGMTVMCWAKGFPGAWNPWVSKYGETTPAPSAGWQLRINNAGPNSCWTIRATGGTEDMTSSVGSNDGQWHHYAGTYSPMTHVRSLYLDGVLVVSQTNQGPYNLANQSHLMIGARDTGSTIGNYFTGKIYDVRVYNYALTQSQIGTTIPGLKPTLSKSVFPGSAGVPGQLVITWSFGTLLEATNVAGPWNPTSYTSPYTNVMTLPQDFFKVQNP